VLFAESGGGIETGTVQGNLEFMIPRRLAVAGDAAHRKKAGMEIEQDPRNIQPEYKIRTDRHGWPINYRWMWINKRTMRWNRDREKTPAAELEVALIR
jgi:hypothetical protein